MEDTPRPAVFLDRDGTVNVDVDYLADPDELVLIEGAAEAVHALNQAGYAVVLVSNQSGVARGLLDERRLAEIHQRLEQLLRLSDARIDAIYYCPHHPSEGSDRYRMDCDCRKPKPGMFERAARELDLDLGASWVIGDSVRDLEAGAALGVPGILVATGKGASQRAELARIHEPEPRCAPNLPAAVACVLDQGR